MELSVPAYPSTKAEFNYQLIDGNYVLTNTRTIGATSSVTIEAAICGLLPMDVVDMSECDDIVARCEVVTNQGNIIELSSTPINAQIDTQARINGALKEGTLYESCPIIPSALLANLPEGTKPDEYIYVRWLTYQTHQNNQPYSLDMTDMLADAYEKVTGEDGSTTNRFVTKGIFLGSTNYDGTVLNEDDNELNFEAAIADHQKDAQTTYGYSKTVYMWSAYKKDAFYVPKATEPQRVYYMENKTEWTLTESDAAVENDPQKVTTATAKDVVTYAPIQWRRPTGRFEVDKWTERYALKDYTYSFALNQLQQGQDVDMSFVVRTFGMGWLWTSAETAPFSSAALAGGGTKEEMESLDGYTFDPDAFGKLGWKQVTYDFDTFFNFESTPLTSEDFQFKSLRVPVPGKSRYAKKTNGDWDYVADATLPTPDLLIEYQVNGEDTWYTAAKATWGETGLEALRFVDVAKGVTTSGNTVYFPENVTDVRHSFVSNVYGGKTAEHSDLAKIEWYVYPTITLKASDRVQAIVDELFQQSSDPSTKFKNDVKMDVYGWLESADDDGEVVLLNDFDYSRATLESAGYGVSLTKNGTVKRNDTENSRIILNYTATVEEKSNLNDRSDYDGAMALGIIPAETSGVWYDLLPVGVSPLLGTVKLREEDKITAVYTIENYKNTGRTMLVVEAELTPVITMKNGSYTDTLTLNFDAVYSWQDMDELGTELVNYVAFESKVDTLYNNTLGTLETRRGEPDNPAGGNNYTTPAMPEDIRLAMTDLDPATDEARFVYGKVQHTASGLTYAVSGLEKSVKNDLVDIWTQGLDGQEQVTVYEGHTYTYRLRVSSAARTATKGIIIYDTIENYIIPDPEADKNTDATKAWDYNHTQERKGWTGAWENAGQWRGALEQVDLSEFVAAGVEPVLVYSVIPGLQFADSASESVDENFSEDTELFQSGNYDITDTSVWTVADVDENGIWKVPAGVSVSAVAIDARKCSDGTDFVLLPEEKLCAYLKMRAPGDNSNPDVWNAKGAYARLTDEQGNLLLDENNNQQVDWEAALNPENNMYAYNNARVRLIQGGVSEGSGKVNWLSSYRMIRNDYTRVGIQPEILKLEKQWKDQDNHDNMRPESITVTLQRRQAVVGSEPQTVLDEDNQPVTAVLDESTGWKATFLQMDAVDENGLPYIYSFKETPVEGYQCQTTFVDLSHYTLVNRHDNVQLSLEGAKVWNDEGNKAGNRPEAVKLKLYRDDELIATKTITGGTEDSWAYSFGQLDKYAPGGREWVYRVEEEYVAKYVGTVEGYEKVTNAYHPYGNLEVSKTLKCATPAAADKAFSFTLVLLAEKTSDDEAALPLPDKYGYAIFEQVEGQWEEKSTGTIGNGDTFTLKQNQKIQVRNLPSECTYQVTEHEAPGFTSTATNAEGTIRAGETAEAAFVNEYAATGGASLSVQKKLTGRVMRKSQFAFELVDKTEGSATYGQVLRMARVSAPEETTGGNGEDIVAQAQAIFGQLSYTHQDDGKTFCYEVREVDNQRPGYTADTICYTVNVTVQDNGDGTLTATPVVQGAESAAFENTYTATGSLQLKAWKVLDGRNLVDGEFTFELWSYNKTTGQTIEKLQTATNDAEGNIVFAALNYDQSSLTIDKDAPMSYAYLICETAGTDDTVIYSGQRFIVTVTVTDNGDGTLSFTQETEALTTTGDAATTTPVAAPVFTNGLKDGGLAITKRVQGDADPEQAFTFHVHIQGESLDDLEYNLATAEPTATPAPTVSVSPGTVAKTTPRPITQPKPTVAPSSPKPTAVPSPKPTVAPSSPKPTAATVYHATAEDLAGEGLAVLNTETGAFVFFRGTGTTTSGGTQYTYSGAASDNEQVTFTFATNSKQATTDVYMCFRDFSDSVGGFPWHTSRDKIKTVAMEGAIKLKSAREMFSQCSNLTTVDIGRMDTSQVTNMSSMFYNCRSLTSLDLSTFDTSQVTNMGGMFGDCNKLTSLDLSTFDTSQVTSMDQMFYGCSKLTSLDLSTFDTSKVTDMYRMFFGCSKLTSLDLSTFDTSQVTDMGGMFYGCSGLPSLDLSTFDTSKVTDMQFMFSGCSSLTSLDLSTFDTSQVTNMSDMFYGCSKLPSLDLSTFDTSQVTNMSYMFYNCSSLTSLDLSTFDTSQVTNMSGMFYGCSGLTSLDLSTFDTSQVTNMSYMFSSCSGLTSLDLSTFDTSQVTNMSDMFSGCSRLATISIGDNTTLRGSYTYPRTSTTKWLCDASEMIKTGEELFPTGNLAGTWRLYTPSYKLSFAAGEGTGSMPTVFVPVKAAYSFSHGFFYYGHRLTGFTDGKGNTYPCVDGGATIPANNAYEEGEAITLTAQWEEGGTPVTMVDDAFTLTLKAGETANFVLPAATAYTVWEDTPAGWVLVSKAGDSGTIQPLETSQAVFTNEYSPSQASAALRASKLLDGKPAPGDMFTFTLHQASDNALLQTLKNADGGAVAFEPITYSQAGTYTYYIQETAGSDSTITYDGTRHNVTVTVTDDGEGVLSAQLEYEGQDAPVFRNSTKPGALEITKSITGATGAAKGQAFAVNVTFTESAAAPWSGKLLVNGTETTVTNGLLALSLCGGEMASITNVPAGLHYTIAETENLPGWTMDSEKEGTIAANATSRVTLTNTYAPTGFATVSITKALVGRDLVEDEFTFTMTDEDGNTCTATNDANGTVTFDQPTFTAEGEYVFTITENVGSDSTVEYSSASVTATVTVTDEDGKGTLTTQVAYTNNATITNNVKTGMLEISKRLISSNESHREKAFAFTIALTNAQGKPLSGQYTLNGQAFTVENGWCTLSLKGGETATISGLPHGATYSVTETDAPGFTSSSTGATGTISASGTATAAFTNTYAAEGSYTFQAEKILAGRSLEEGEFAFVLKKDDTVLETAMNDANGKVTFGKVSFTHSDVGQHTYTMAEQNTMVAGVTYDTTVHTITLTVADNGDGTLSVTDSLQDGETITFANTYSDKTSISVEKVWDDNADALGLRPSQVTVKLLRNRVEVDSAVIKAEEGWHYTFANLPAIDAEGVPYTYEVREVPVTGYASSATYGTGTATITNTLLGAIKVGKTVVDGNLQKAFTFTAALTKAGQPMTEKIAIRKGETITQVTPDAQGCVTFTLKHGETAMLYALPAGTAYQLTEAAEMGFTATSTGATGVAQRGEMQAAAFTNTYKAQAEVTLTAKKTLNGQEPTAEQQYLFQLTDEQGQSVQATNSLGDIAFVLHYDVKDAGKTFTYTMQEISTPTDLMKTDTTLYTVDVSVTDNGDGTLKATPVFTAAGEPVEEMTFANLLYAPLTISKTVEGCETAETFEFTVRLYDENGKEATGAYTYTGDKTGSITSGESLTLGHGQSITMLGLQGMGFSVEETAQAAFTTKVNGMAGTLAEGTLVEGGNQIAFVNTLNTTTFVVTKRWQGGGGGAVELTLYADGVKLSPQPECIRDGNVYTYTGLPMYNTSGERVVYSAKERYVDGFLTIYSNVEPYENETKFIYDGGTIINKRIPKPDFVVTKEWKSLADGEKAPEITLVLYCNGEPTDVKTPKPDNSGRYMYYDLPSMVNGEKAVYTVKEGTLDGYTTSYTLANGDAADYADNGGVITNTRIPKTGDETPLALWMAVLGASLAMLAVLRRKRA